MFIFLSISAKWPTHDTVRKFQNNHKGNHLFLTFEFPVAIYMYVNVYFCNTETVFEILIDKTVSNNIVIQ